MITFDVGHDSCESIILAPKKSLSFSSVSQNALVSRDQLRIGLFSLRGGHDLRSRDQRRVVLLTSRALTENWRCSWALPFVAEFSACFLLELQCQSHIVLILKFSVKFSVFLLLELSKSHPSVFQICSKILSLFPLGTCQSHILCIPLILKFSVKFSVFLLLELAKVTSFIIRFLLTRGSNFTPCQCSHDWFLERKMILGRHRSNHRSGPEHSSPARRAPRTQRETDKRQKETSISTSRFKVCSMPAR